MQLDKLKQLGQGVPALRAEANSLTSRLHEAQENNASLRLHLASVERQLEKAVEDASAECGALEAQLKSVRAEFSNYLAKDTSHTPDIQEYLQASIGLKLKALEAQVVELESERSSLRSERDGLILQLASAGDKEGGRSGAHLADDISVLRKELASSWVDLQLARDQVQELTSKLEIAESGREAAEQVCALDGIVRSSRDHLHIRFSLSLMTTPPPQYVSPSGDGSSCGGSR